MNPLIRRRLLGGAVGGKVPIPDGTILLLHCDGSIVDETGRAMATTGGNMNFVQSLPNYDQAFDYSGNSYVRTSGVFPSISNTYTIAMWVYPISSTGTLVYYSWAPNEDASYSFSIRYTGSSITANYYPNGTGFNVTTSIGIPINGWHHFAFVSNNNVATIYLDGTAIGTKSINSYISMGSDVLNFGADYASYSNPTPRKNFNGYMDEIIITQGTAIWTENFTPPQYPFE